MIPRNVAPDIYPAGLLIAVLVGVTVGTVVARRRGFAMGSILYLQGVLAIAGLVGAKLYALTGELFRGMPPPSTFWAGGFRYPGGILAAVVMLPFAAKLSGIRQPLARLGDALVPGVAFAMAAVRVGCLLAGCCYGRVSELPWAIRFPARSPAWSDQVFAGILPATATCSLPVHPLQVYFGTWSLAVGLFALWMDRKKTYDGQVVLFFFLLHETGKGLLESLRAPEPLRYLQLVSLSLAAAAGLTLAVVRRRSVTARAVLVPGPALGR